MAGPTDWPAGQQCAAELVASAAWWGCSDWEPALDLVAGSPVWSVSTLTSLPLPYWTGAGGWMVCTPEALATLPAVAITLLGRSRWPS